MLLVSCCNTHCHALIAALNQKYNLFYWCLEFIVIWRLNGLSIADFNRLKIVFRACGMRGSPAPSLPFIFTAMLDSSKFKANRSLELKTEGPACRLRSSATSLIMDASTSLLARAYA